MRQVENQVWLADGFQGTTTTIQTFLQTARIVRKGERLLLIRLTDSNTEDEDEENDEVDVDGKDEKEDG